MESGTQELSRIATGYVASVAFGFTFVAASAFGADGTTALLRAVLVTAAALVAGRLLAVPVVDAVLAAMARDQAQKPRGPGEEDGP